MIDAREVKKILQKHFPRARFSIRYGRVGLRRVLDIKTDLLKYGSEEKQRLMDLDYKLRTVHKLTPEESDEWEFLMELKERDKKMRNRILDVLAKYGIEPEIYRDPVSGEILSGGFSIHIEPLGK